MNYVYYAVDYSDSLSHHGVKGQKWGVRRFQNPDGTWTEEGRKRRGRQRYAIANGAGIVAGGAMGLAGVLSGNPMLVGGSIAAGIAARNSAFELMDYKEDYAWGGNNPNSPRSMGTKQTKKWNKKVMQDPDYLTMLKDSSEWMPSTAKEYRKDSNDFYNHLAKNNKDLQKFMKDNYGDSPEQIKNHLKKSMKGLSESSEEESSYSGKLMQDPVFNNATNAYAKGFIDSKTFDNFYDSSATYQVAYTLRDYDVSQPHYKEDLKAIIDEGDRLYSQNKKNGVGRLDNWFSEDPDMNPEKKLKHFFYSVNELYAWVGDIYV